MKKTHERDAEFRGDSSGVKYLVQGDNGEGGVMVLNPGASLSDTHYHARVEEFFYVISGQPTLIVNGREHILEPGDGCYVQPEERHTIVNDRDLTAKLFFIKCPTDPQDRHIVTEDS